MPANSVFFSKTNRTWIFACGVLALLIAVAMWRTCEEAMNMELAAPAGSAGFKSLKPGDVARIVLEVADSSPQTIKGTLLEKKTETVYVRTGEVAESDFDSNTSFVMGKVADIHPGAVLHITGAITSTHTVQARQIVVLTGYVQAR